MKPRAQLNEKPRVFAVILAAVLVYWPALHGAWLWDDNLLVVSNARLHSLAGLAKIWFAAPTTDYWPLSWTLLWLEWHLWGDAPLGYHLVSLALHVASAFLIWRVLAQLGCSFGWIGALLFAVHPLAVESVAWISEIKNTLSLPLFLLAFSAWLEAEDGRRWAYALSLLSFLLALLAKTSTVMLPLVLALYGWWARGGITRAEVLWLAPYFALALVLGAITLHFQERGQNLTPVEPTGLAARLIVAGTALCFYLGKFLLPFDLLAIYPAWPLDPPTLTELLALPALAALFVLLIVVKKEWARNALFGLGFFVITALPVLGLVRMQWLQFSPVADHLVYLPMVGLVGLAAALAESMAARVPENARAAGGGVLALILATLAVTGCVTARRYANGLDFWSYTLAHNPLAWPAYTGLGDAMAESGRSQAALPALEMAIHLKPDYAAGHYDLANALLALGRGPEAIAEYRSALQLNPQDAQAWYNLGNALLQSDRADEALAPYENAVRLIPDAAEIRGNYAQALMRSGHVREALAQFQEAAQLDPTSATAAYNLGVALLQTGYKAEAVAQFQRALRLQPDFAAAEQMLTRVQAAPQP